MLHYHGVFAPRAKLRKSVLGRRRNGVVELSPAKRKTWAELLKRTFGYVLTTCPKCGARRRVLEGLYPGPALKRILIAHGESTEPPLRAKARDPPQIALALSAPEQWFDEGHTDVGGDQRAPGSDVEFDPGPPIEFDQGRAHAD